jgi:hypothetical protein
MKHWTGVVLGALIFFALLSNTAFAENPVVASFVGQGFSSSLGEDITVSAERRANGLVSGSFVAAGNFSGKVVELVSPYGDQDWWCLHVEQISAGCASESIWFFKDNLGEGEDEVSFVDGFNLSCSDFPNGSPDAFWQVDQGGFTGTILNPCESTEAELAQCESDLGDCSTNLTACNQQVATLQNDLDECESDLTECGADMGRNALPALPEGDFDAKLTGNGFLESLGGKLKISAQIKAGEVHPKSKTKLPNGTIADVLEIVPPHNEKSYWCVRDTNGIWFVRDTGKGCDMVSHLSGTELSCESADPPLPFEIVVKGDFKGQKSCGKKQCCL